VRWAFDPIPVDPADPAAATWEDGSAARTGAANAWAPPSADPQRGLVFVSTGSASPDFFGGERLGDNRHANSVVALDAADGSVVWSRQLVHHDVWDYDVPMQPTLVDLPMAGGPVPAVVVATKTGMLFAFHRETGADLHRVEERPVPASDVPGERLSPTQPYSTLPAIADRRALGPDDAFGVVWFDERRCREILSTWRSEGLFTPPTTTGSIMNPSWAGGANWGGVSVRPDGLAIVNASELPGQLKLIPIEEADAARASGDYDGWEITAMRGTPWAMARRIFLSPLGLPCTEPPWGRVTAVDLVTGERRWSRPLGTTADLAPAIVPDIEWGTPLMGGTLQTGGGLVFVGAAAEHAFRALDAATGETLWARRMPAAPMATPMSYVLDGVQYVVVAAGGHSHALDHRGDHLMAFRLAPAR
jgi:quinoprotein glucose dehydrogenase